MCSIPEHHRPRGPIGLAGALVGLACAAVVTLASPAGADEGERILSVYGGLASFAAGVGADDSETVTGIGFGLGFDYERGLTKAVWLRLSAGGAIYTGRPASLSGHGTLGLTYVFDVLKYVPYAHIGVGGVALHADQAPEATDPDRSTQLEPLIEIGIGLDVLSSESMSWGGHLRFESFLDRTALVTGGLRISWRWGFF